MSKPFQKNRSWMYISIVLALILIIYIVLYPPGNKPENDTVTLAKVNGVTIGKDKLYDALVATGGMETLDKLINNEIVRQAAEKQGIKVTDADIEKEMESIREGFVTEEEFESTLSMYGMTLEGLKSDMSTQVQLRKLFEPQVKITDEDIQKYYDENLESLKTPEQVKASHILSATKAEAEAILTELKAGADFAATAKEKSTDTVTKDNGGELEMFAKGVNEEAIDNAVFALEIGEISGVVEASDGFHIYRLTEKQEAVTPTLEEKKEEIREAIMVDQISTLSSDWMTEQQATANIENFLSSDS